MVGVFVVIPVAIRFHVVAYPILVVVVFTPRFMAAYGPSAQHPRKQRPSDADYGNEKNNERDAVLQVYEHRQADAREQCKRQYEIASSSIQGYPLQ